ncbi:molybdopterin-dependent oxidoreductase [Desulfofalx alkaliphila]|uniref:molybdopterin-dependent oxidoreductase n=1 Tax=Desulfofalx alkaliphila TaxID=105483 RepID=UPI0004E1AD86|nr:molybdopterin-dependent oxidoreductase [Desulfofalx alkaliphila]
MNINNRLVYWSIGLLIVMAVALIYLMPSMDEQSDSLTIIKKGQQVKIFTMEEIKALPAVTRQVTIRSASEGINTYNFTGTPVREVLIKADEEILQGSKEVTVKGMDYFTVVFACEEIMEDDNVLLVYAQDDQPLGDRSSGGTGPFRIIILRDQFGMRAVKYVDTLEVN